MTIDAIGAYGPQNLNYSHPEEKAVKDATKVTKIVGNYSRSINYIQQHDKGSKSIHLDLGAQERELLFTAGDGSVGKSVLNHTLIASVGSPLDRDESALSENRYTIKNASDSNARLEGYSGLNHTLSSRVDILI